MVAIVFASQTVGRSRFQIANALHRAQLARMFRLTPFRTGGAISACLLWSTLPAQDDPTYRLPSAALTAIVEAPLTPLVSVSPDKQHLLLLERSSWPPVAELAEPELRLAGLRLNPATNGPSRELYYTALVLKRLTDEPGRRVSGFPRGGRLTNPAWSRDGRHIVVTLTHARGQELWLVEVTSASAHRLSSRALNGLMTAPAWVDDKTIVASFIPDNRGAPPLAPAAPAGPVVQENLGGKRPARTYPDLLANAHDESLFEFYARADLALVALDGRVTPLGIRGLLGELAPSPDGNYILVTTWTRPYSYFVPVDRFPARITVHDRAGKLIHTMAELPLAENIPIANGSVRTGPRQVTWRADAPATLSWLEALDDGDAGRETVWRDAWFTQAAPFTGPSVAGPKFGYRVSGITWGDDEHAVVTELWWKTRRQRTWFVAPARPEAGATLLFDRSSEDRYANPGSPVTTRNAYGRSVLLLSADKRKIYLDGAGASPEGDRPFLDEFDLTTKQSRRLWRSQAPYYESFVAFLDEARTVALTQRESEQEPPNLFRRRLAGANDASALTPITRFTNPYPQFNDVKKELIAYRRADGVMLSGTLYLPPGRG
ncbi:MAG: hypothetical protein RIQ93_3339, partial [Verrucomicrobiota bacterium]